MTSPGTSGPPVRQTYLDTPPLSQATDTGPAQYVYMPSPTHLSPTSSLSPEPRHNEVSSPHPSYYSVSDIPIPSPLPSPKYRYPNGEITSTPPSRRNSVATTRASIRTTVPHSPMPTSPPLPPPQPTSSPARQNPAQYAQAGDAGAYEMRVRSPPLLSPPLSPGFGDASSQGHTFERSISHASFVTANSEYATAEDDVGPYGQPSPQYYGEPQQYQQYGQHLDSGYAQHDDVDRRASGASASSWQGGRAL